MDTEPLAFPALTTMLKAAGEATRLRILALIAEAELTVSDLTEILRQSQPRLSRHLRLLAEAGLVERFREGSWAFFRLRERGSAADIARAMITRLDANDSVIARDRERLAAVRTAASRSRSRAMTGSSASSRVIMARAMSAALPRSRKRKNAHEPSRKRSTRPASARRRRWRESRGCDWRKISVRSETVSSASAISAKMRNRVASPAALSMVVRAGKGRGSVSMAAIASN